jgi:hypothetical protein
VLTTKILEMKQRPPEQEGAFDIWLFLHQVHWGKCYNQDVNEIISDTRPEIAALQRRLMRQVGPARKLAMVGQMNQTIKALALSGLQSRYPDETPEMLRRRLADLVLGPILANQVYGPQVVKT